jgi:hypothetical protein
MTPLDSLKAGLKTSIVTFIVGLVLALSGLVNEVNAYVTDGNPIDWSVGTSAVVALAGALLVGALNALMRFVQVAGVPFLGSLVDKILGAVPAYPEQGAAKVVTAPAAPGEPEFPTTTDLGD